MLGATLPTPLYPIYEQELGFGGVMVTLIFAAYAVGVTAALLLFGRLSDQVGRRRSCCRASRSRRSPAPSS